MWKNIASAIWEISSRKTTCYSSTYWRPFDVMFTCLRLSYHFTAHQLEFLPLISLCVFSFWMRRKKKKKVEFVTQSNIPFCHIRFSFHFSYFHRAKRHERYFCILWLCSLRASISLPHSVDLVALLKLCQEYFFIIIEYLSLYLTILNSLGDHLGYCGWNFDLLLLLWRQSSSFPYFSLPSMKINYHLLCLLSHSYSHSHSIAQTKRVINHEKLVNL